MKFPSEIRCILDVHNIDEMDFSINYLFNVTNGDSKCLIVKCRSHIKEGVLNEKNWLGKNVS